MNVDDDLYNILNLEPEATNKEIRKQFRKLSVRYHPDKCSNNQDMYDKIILAYNVLKNPDTRREYDQLYYMNLNTQTDIELKQNSQNAQFEIEKAESVDEINHQFNEQHSQLFDNFRNENINKSLQKMEKERKKDISMPKLKAGINEQFEHLHQSRNIIEYHEPSANVLNDNCQDIHNLSSMYQSNHQSSQYFDVNSDYITDIQFSEMKKYEQDKALSNKQVASRIKKYQNDTQGLNNPRTTSSTSSLKDDILNFHN